MLLNEALKDVLQDKISKTTSVKMSLMEKYKFYIYICWTYVNPLLLHSASKKGYEAKPDLEYELHHYAHTAFSKNYVELTKRKISDSTELRMISIGVHLPEQLDKVIKRVGTEPASQIVAAETICKLIFDHEVDLRVELELYQNIWINAKAIDSLASKLFIIPEEDWDWKKVLTEE